MSVDENDRGASEPAVEALPVLRREAIIVHQERGRIATLVAVCSLLGVALGFSLSTMAAAMQAASASSHQRSLAYYEAMTPPTWLGIAPSDAREHGGALVKRVREASPAAAIGLRAGDVIVAVDGIPVRGADELVSLIRAEPPGTTVAIDVLRRGTRQILDVTLAQMPAHIAATQR
jgi:predicted metalloprotease with PDZ domain